MEVQGTTKPTGIPKSPRALSAPSWEGERHKLKDVPGLVDAGRIPPNANVRITADMREAPEREGETQGMRPILHDALVQQADGQIELDGTKEDTEWLYGDQWIIDIPARRTQRVWSALRQFTTAADFETEIGPPQTYEEPPTSDEDEGEADWASPPTLVAGGVAVAAAALLWYQNNMPEDAAK